MSFKKVVVAGGGVLGSQIAFQAAYCGFDVTIWLRSESSKTRTQPKLNQVKKSYLEAIELMKNPEVKGTKAWSNGIADPDTFDPEACKAKVEKAASSLILETDMKKAFSGADIIIESMTENKNAKISFYKNAAPNIDPETVLVTNSSTMLPSTFAKYTGRPDKYLAMHFANKIWHNNTVEIMGQEKTVQKYYDEVVEFAKEIRMIPLCLHKEKNGYITNSMLVPFLLSALDLWATGVSDPETIDLTWTVGIGQSEGPFHIMDVVGLKTCREIVGMFLKVPSFLAPYHFKEIASKLDEKIAAGELGVAAGKGFFDYSKK